MNKVWLKKTDIMKIRKLSEEEDQEYREASRHDIYCRFCGNFITKPEEKTLRQGSHRHVFTNPAGIVFEIVLFKKAPGCVDITGPTYEYTWFKGYAWSVSVCSECQNHLGWHWIGNDDAFYGLILDRIVEGPIIH